jgi:hypothetical protein
MVSEWSVRDVMSSARRKLHNATVPVLVDRIHVVSKHYSSLDCLRCLRTTISRTSVMSTDIIGRNTCPSSPLARIPAVVVVS